MPQRRAPAPELTGGATGLGLGALSRLGERVGEGASSVVYRGELDGGGACAVKVARAAASSLPEEARILAVLEPRWGPRLLAAGRAPRDLFVGVDEGVPLLVLEWTEGERLDVAWPRITPATRARAAWVVAHAVSRALEELHAAGMRHGDVKPANILFRTHAVTRDAPGDRGATLIDLGLSHGVDEQLRGATPRYASPEIQRGEPATPAADVFALGVVLSELRAADAKDGGQLDALVRSLTAPAPGGRPTAGWVADEAARILRLERRDEDVVERRRDHLRRAYLRVRGRELGAAGSVSGVEGTPRAWLEGVLARTAPLREHEASERGVLGPLDALRLARWLVLAVGPQAASWALTPGSEARLAEVLSARAAVCPLEALSLSDLDAEMGPASQAVPAKTDPVALVRLLGLPRAPIAAIERAEELARSREVEPALVGELVWALLRRGETGRAATVVEPHLTRDVELSLAAAEVARRLGDLARAEALATTVEASGERHWRGLARALLGRIAWERGDLAHASSLATGVREAQAEEVLALVAYARGDALAGLDAVARGALLADGGVVLARLDGVRGMLEHLRGNADASATAFASAVQHATRSGALVEEATYLTGLAAAAVDAGRLREALTSATRAALLWERLGRPGQAARALLSRASALALLGVRHEADEASLLAQEMARASGDVRAEAFARWAIAETRAPGDARARAEVLAADAALSMLPESSTDDALRSAARLLVWADDAEQTRNVDVASLDARAATATAGARWEWWGARATRGGDRVVLASLLALLGAPAALASRGPALAAGARLAEMLDDGEAARRLEGARTVAAESLRTDVPAEHRAAVAQVAWARVDPLRTTAGAGLGAAQVEELESIVRALSGRDRLKPLLEQVLDTMVLWTGVERGLLLLRAPDGRLVPRVARNLGKRDLEGEQIALSTSLARRAMDTREPVVATDAFAQVGDVHASVHALGLRSVLAVPLIARGDVLGVVYLDDRVRRGAFGAAELSWVRLVASHAAQAVADARDQALLRRAVRRAERATQRLLTELGAREVELHVARAELAQGEGTRFRYDRITGRSEPMRALLRTVDRVTTSTVPVLLVGESGTGKELLARAIHENGPRKGRAFVSESCASVPEALLESTLFGHVKGAFTGAAATRPGLFDVADGGTLFLDEIGEMPLTMQSKLLRVLQEGEVRAVGSARSRKVDVRIIGATHRDLGAMVAEKTFREDLLYRLDVVTIRVPPLRERAADIPELVARLVEKHGAGRGIRLTRAAMDRLVAYPWPGNVRQLENELRRALVLGGDVIDVSELSEDVARGGPGAAREAGVGLRARLDELEKQLVREALERTKGNQTRAAEVLGVSRFGLQKMMRRLGIDGGAKPLLTARLDSPQRPK